MKVMVIVKASRASEAGEMPSEKLLTEMGKFNEALADAGLLLEGEGLHPSSKGKRVTFSGKDRQVTDGPFAETKELIGGFWMWQVKSMDEALEWVKRCPNPHDEGGEIEIRPVFSAEDFGAAFTPELREQEAAIRAKAMGLGAVRFETGRETVVAGLNRAYTPETRNKIPAQWQRFAPQIGKVPGQVGTTSYGVCWNTKPDCGFDYLSGVEVQASAAQPPELTRVTIPARRYAVFAHDAPVSSLPKTLDAIWNKWVPDSGLQVAKAPCFERYTDDFDPQSGRGGIEIWIPLET